MYVGKKYTCIYMYMYIYTIYIHHIYIYIYIYIYTICQPTSMLSRAVSLRWTDAEWTCTRYSPCPLAPGVGEGERECMGWGRRYTRNTKGKGRKGKGRGGGSPCCGQTIRRRRLCLRRNLMTEVQANMYICTHSPTLPYK